MACEDDLEIRGKGDTLDLREHFFEVAAVDGLGQFKRSTAQTIGSQPAVGTYKPGPTTEADDAATAGTLQQFVIDEADFLIENGREQLRIVRLQFVGVAEKEVGLAGHQVLNVDLLHPNEHIAIGNVFTHIEARSAVFGIADAAHRAGLNGNFQLRKTLLEQDALVRRQWYTLVRRGLSFSDDAQLERLFRGVSQIEKLLQRSYTTPCSKAAFSTQFSTAIGRQTRK